MWVQIWVINSAGMFKIKKKKKLSRKEFLIIEAPVAFGNF